MLFHTLIIGVFLSGVLARPQCTQYTIPCPVTYPTSPGYGQTPTLNIVIRTENQKEVALDDSSASASCPPLCPPPCPPPCPPLPCPCSPNSRRFCTSICSLPGAILDSILSGEVNI